MFHLLQQHLKCWFDNLKVSPELPYHTFKGTLQHCVLKVQLLEGAWIQLRPLFPVKSDISNKSVKQIFNLQR